MSRDLYHAALLAAAAEGFGKGRIENPAASAALDNPLCGDRVVVDLAYDAESRPPRIAAIGHAVKGCLLCEAAAASLAKLGQGMSPAELRRMIAAIEDLLQEGRAPPATFAALGIFAPVHGAKARRDCVRLPFQALSAALDRLPPPPD